MPRATPREKSARTTRRYAALLRGVSPMNARMPDLVAAFEAAGFTSVVTVLSSGNVVFDAAERASEELEAGAETAMRARTGRAFTTTIRSIDALRALLDADPFARFAVPAEAKRVVSFLREPPARAPAFPIEREGATIWGIDGLHVLTSYVRIPGNPVFMQLLERTFGDAITTRTWDTVRKIAAK